LEKRFGNDIETKLSNSTTDSEIYQQIKCILTYFVKDLNTDKLASELVDDIDYIIKSFELHNTYDQVLYENIKAYNFGCTSSVYRSESKTSIVKVYNDKLRWKKENHDNIDNIFDRELKILDRLEMIQTYSESDLILRMPWVGESLYQNFNLPGDWEIQISNIFNGFTQKSILYPEFNLNNITVLNGRINFVDYGLAEINENCDNSANCKNFIEILKIISDKFDNVDGFKQRHIVYNTFMSHLRHNKIYPNNVF
jgi:hypothetical protein